MEQMHLDALTFIPIPPNLVRKNSFGKSISSVDFILYVDFLRTPWVKSNENGKRRHLEYHVIITGSYISPSEMTNVTIRVRKKLR